MIKTELQYYTFETQSICLCVPNKQDLFFAYKQEHPFEPFPDNSIKNPYPFWAKIWHSAVALSQFITENQDIIKNKKVLEIAAGLGLPSLVAAKYAQSVISTDYQEDALDYIKQSIAKNNLDNVYTQLLDWNTIPDTMQCDVLLMSDVNYEPQAFEVLYQVFTRFLNQGTTIILATPQRLMAKPFIEQILPFCTVNKEYAIVLNEEEAFVNVLLLKALA